MWYYNTAAHSGPKESNIYWSAVNSQALQQNDDDGGKEKLKDCSALRWSELRIFYIHYCVLSLIIVLTP